MDVLQGMDPDKMIIIFPTALVAMYLIIRVQKTLSERTSPYPGLVLPVLCFIVSTVLALRPLLFADNVEHDGLGLFCLRMWFTFNISTIVFLFPYYRQRKYMRALRDAEATSQEEHNDESTPQENSDKDVTP